MYYLNDDGVVTDVNHNKDVINYTVTLYPKDDDLNRIVDTCPLVYTNMEHLLKDIQDFSKSKTSDIPSWLDHDEMTVVIRKCKIACAG